MRSHDLKIQIVYWFMLLLRRLFLSSRFGAWLHNAFYYAAWKLLQPKLAGENRLMTALWSSIAGGNGVIYAWQGKFYTSAPAVWQHALRANFINKRFVGLARRRKFERQGHIVPSMITVSVNSPGSGCNLSCAHCYASAHEDAVLPAESLRRILVEQENLGIYSVLVSGGEPFLYPGIMRFFQEFPDTCFDVATNGTLVTEEIAKELATLGNVNLLFSIEGFKEETDRVRGQGVYTQVLRAMSYCKASRLPYSVTITVTRENLVVVTSDKFMSMLEQAGCFGVNFSTYLALGARPHPEWELTNDQVEMLESFRRQALHKYAMIVTVGRNGTSNVTDCYAGRQFFHILPTGLVEGCPFVHWADPALNIGDCSILDLTASPLFQRVRDIASQGVAGLMPCRAGQHQEMWHFLSEVAQPTETRG